MKSSNIFNLAILVVSFVSIAMSMPFSDYSNLSKRDVQANKPVYLTFKEINAIIAQLDDAQNNPVPPGPPDFNASAYLLNQLSMKADEATSLLKQMGDDQLDDESVSSISHSLSSMAKHVVAITNLVEQGKDWFAKYNATSKVVEILQLNAFQFAALFKELEQHIPATVYAEYGKSITTFLCSIINAIEYLDPNASAPQGKQFCSKCQNDQSQYYQGDSFDYTQLAPPGMDTCDNSAANYLQCAYQQETIGTQSTTCDSQSDDSSSYILPQNALLL